MKRYHIMVGDKTTAEGIVRTGNRRCTINGQPMACEGDEVWCPQCESTGYIAIDGPHLIDTIDGRHAALGDDLCRCNCDPSPRLVSSQTLRSQSFEGTVALPRNHPAYAEPPLPDAPAPSAFSQARQPAPAVFSTPQTQGCEHAWRAYQKMAEAIVAPGGTLIADPKARNRAINAAYARLWLQDPRLQWAGLAAFASKQVGCGLLHAADSIEKIEAEQQAFTQRKESARRGFFGLFGGGERERQRKLQEFEQARREHEQASLDNPLPGIDWRREGESLSSVQQLYRHVYDMLAMGNTTLFLDVYPLHVFYMQQGFGALESCLRVREDIYQDGDGSVLWPVEQETLKFGGSYTEILEAFRAIQMGRIAESVEHLATHEQVNILQPTMYSDQLLVALLRGNHLAYVTNLLPGAAQPIELTLASQCVAVDDGRTIGFGNNPLADLSNIEQRMAFVLRAAAQFHQLLQGGDRFRIEQAIRDISAGEGVR